MYKEILVKFGFKFALKYYSLQKGHNTGYPKQRYRHLHNCFNQHISTRFHVFWYNKIDHIGSERFRTKIDKKIDTD